jgi:DNA-binding MarR family transcriptional regulator
MCASFRRSSRALTGLYEAALRPYRLTATQFTILQVLAENGEASQGQLGEVLVMDSTTLTRTLQIMRRQGWIAERRGKDRRQRWLRLAKAGQLQLQRAQPVWEEVQSRLRREVGATTWDELLQLANKVAAIASHQGDHE